MTCFKTKRRPDLFNYSELSFKAQLKAIRQYIEGWEETHEKGDIDETEVHTSLQGDPFYKYTIEGNYKGEYLHD